MDDNKAEPDQDVPQSPDAAADQPPAAEADGGDEAGTSANTQGSKTGILARIKKWIDETTLIVKALTLLVGAVVVLSAKLGIDFLFPGNGVDTDIKITGCNQDRIEFNLQNKSKEKIEIRNIEVFTEVGESKDSVRTTEHFLPSNLLEASNRASGSGQLAVAQGLEVQVPLSEYLREPAETRFIDAAAARAAKISLVLELVEGDFFNHLAENGSPYPYCKVRVEVTVGDRIWGQPSGSCTCQTERFQ